MTSANQTAFKPHASSRVLAALTVVGMALLLTACILMPGKFSSSLDMRKDGRFSFTYTGEIHFISPSDLDDKKSGEADGKKKDSEAEQMAAMSGALDLSDPKNAAEFASKLSKQHGWRSVKYMGNGRFDVDYAISGTLTHDFIFPVIDDMPSSNPFVQVILRDDGSARVRAPGFSAGTGGSPLLSMARLGAMSDSDAESGKKKGPQLPKIDGTFVLTTDGTLLANNTEEGPQAIATGTQLNWTINDRTDHPPTALVNLKN